MSCEHCEHCKDRVDPPCSAVRVDLPYKEARQILTDAFERAYITYVVTRAQGNLSHASRAAQLDRSHIRELLRKHQITIGNRRRPSPTETDSQDPLP